MEMLENSALFSSSAGDGMLIFMEQMIAFYVSTVSLS